MRTEWSGLGLTDTYIRNIADSMAFRASTAAYLVLGTDLRIRAANLAYQRATHHAIADMLGEFMFDVFPDNPATPEARSVERLAASFERVMRGGKSDRMELQRYDVVDSRYGFVQKSWLPVNSPIRDAEGKTLGLLHHVEDVTCLVAATGLECDLDGPRRAERAETQRASARTLGLAEALRRDALERRARARGLIHESHLAIERLSHRIKSID